MEHSKTRLKVGLFVTLSFFLFAAAILWLAGSRFFQPVDTYAIYFTRSVSGLLPGAAVEYQGVTVGKVEALRPDRLAGVRATRLGGLSYRESVRLEGSDGDAKSYRIARNRPGNRTPGEDSDIWAIQNNYVSVTPLRPGMGYAEDLPRVEALLEGLRAADGG